VTRIEIAHNISVTFMSNFGKAELVVNHQLAFSGRMAR
jgi:hypothetical protein